MNATEWGAVKPFSRLYSLWFIVGLAALIQNANAVEITAGTAALQLPTSDYRFQSYQFQLTHSIGSGRYTWGLSSTLPYEVLGYSQLISNFSFSREFSLNSKSSGSMINPFVALGGGLYMDQVNSERGIVPSLVTRGGIRAGLSSFGVIAQFECYAGIYSFTQLRSWVIWPLTQISGGLYVHF